MSERYQLYQGDCLKLLRSIPDSSIDMVLCDLPYGCTRNEWDKPIDLGALWPQYKRVIRRGGGVIALFGKQRFAIELAASNLKQFRYKIVWQKTNGTDFLNANRKPLSCHEDILVFYDKQPTYNPQKRTGFKPYLKDQLTNSKRRTSNFGEFRPALYQENKDGSRYPIDVVTYAYSQQNGHTTSKPVPLCEWLIKTYTNEGMTVLDNCMGCGTTGIACMNTGRRFIGMELNQKFFDMASERIAAAASRLDNQKA